MIQQFVARIQTTTLFKMTRVSEKTLCNGVATAWVYLRVSTLSCGELQSKVATPDGHRLQLDSV